LQPVPGAELTKLSPTPVQMIWQASSPVGHVLVVLLQTAPWPELLLHAHCQQAQSLGALHGSPACPEPLEPPPGLEPPPEQAAMATAIAPSAAR
jgi:hypothetical protein